MKCQDKSTDELIVLMEKLQKESEIYKRETVRHKLTASKLKESEEKLHNVFDLSTVGQSISTIDGRLQTNSAFCQTLGYSNSELANIKWTSITHPDDIQYNIEIVNRILSGENGSARWEKRYIHKNGSVVWADINTALHRDEQGEPIYFITSIIDITSRKLAEESLRKSEERFHGIFNKLQDAFIQADLSGNISLLSPSAVTMFGCHSAGEMIGKPENLLYADVEDRSRLHKELSANGSVVDYVALGRKVDGTTFWVSMNVQFKYENGNISGTERLVRDITERKIQEDQINTFSRAVEQSPVMIVITDTNGIIEYVNPKFSETTGYSKEEVLGQNPRILKSDNKIQVEYKRLWDTILGGNVWHGEFCNVKKNGEIYFESASISPIIDEYGNIKHFIAVKEDITEKKQMVNDLIKAKEKAEESDRLKSAFLANMSHEIRTPMNGILGFTELLKEPNLSGSEQQTYIKIIEESGDRMLNLMNNLIDISRIESGETKVLISSCNIKKHLDNVYDFFVHEANKKQLKLVRRFNLSPGESMIETDALKLDSILINLVKNAIKFTRHGTIEFGCTRQGNNFRFFVKDSGVGIDSEYQKIIFDRFRQADESLSRPFEGAGLGLSISKAFVNALGGNIWVESEAGNGSTFYFILPVNLREKEVIADKRTLETNKTKVLQEELKVLIVEDDDASMDYLEIIAGTFCRKFLKARNGQEAVEIFYANQDINLILMDIKLHVMDGLEATRQIRQFNKEVIIIAQTAYSMIGDKEKALEAGCNDYISKPIIKDELRSLIQFHIKNK